MGKLLIFCGLMMAAITSLAAWLQPGSLLLWFAGMDSHAIQARWLAMAVMSTLFVAEIYIGNFVVRMAVLAGSLYFIHDAAAIFLNQSVYVLDFLIVAMAGVCSLMIALQPDYERVAMPALHYRSELSNRRGLRYALALAWMPLYANYRLRRLGDDRQAALNQFDYRVVTDSRHRLTTV